MSARIPFGCRCVLHARRQSSRCSAHGPPSASSVRRNVCSKCSSKVGPWRLLTGQMASALTVKSTLNKSLYFYFYLFIFFLGGGGIIVASLFP